MGTLPNPRGKRPFRPVRRGTRWKAVGILAVVVVFGPVVLDAASLLWRKSEGCSVWSVVDGDTVRMICPEQGMVSGRILGYDTPEFKARCPQEFGKAVAATALLHWQLWTAREVVARPRGRDRYGRVLTLFAVDQESAGRRLVDAGLARWYDGGPRGGWCSSQGDA